MTDLKDRDDTLGVVDGVDNPVVSLPNAVAGFIARQFLASRRARVTVQSLDARDNALTILLLSNSLEFFRSGVLDKDPIFCHAVSAP